MTRRNWFTVGCAFISSCVVRMAKAQERPPVEITVGDHKAVTVRFPLMSKNDISKLISVVLMPEDHVGDLRKVLDNAGDITLIMTTEDPARR